MKYKIEDDDGAKRWLQIAALPYRRAEGLEILLVTSRDTGRWVIPKGWPMKGKSLADSAAQEAWEEAGVRGAVGAAALGAYRYSKLAKSGRALNCRVDVFALDVADQADDWPERHERRPRWFTRQAAAEAVEEPELKALILGFFAD